VTDDPMRRRRAIEMRTPKENRFHPHTPLGPGSEFDAIRRMLERWGPNARRIGDDAGVITTLGERAVVVSTDTAVENVHFRREWLTPQEIGYRAAAAALSDLAAMGAKPLGLLSALVVPDSWRDSLDGIGDGIGEAAATSETPIIGGDLSRGTELSLSFTALGTTRDVLFRTSARPGDRVYLTGRLGAAGAALEALLGGRDPQPEHRVKFARPVPRIKEATWLAAHGVQSAIDISDGLGGDLRHLAAASRVRIDIDLDAVCTVPGVSAIDAARSGEEYELVVTTPTDLDIIAFEQKFDVELTRIGVVEQGPPDVTFSRGGETVEVPVGYLHFKSH
jgi:thiamine-monophosphate kinase